MSWSLAPTADRSTAIAAVAAGTVTALLLWYQDRWSQRNWRLERDPKKRKSKNSGAEARTEEQEEHHHDHHHDHQHHEHETATASSPSGGCCGGGSCGSASACSSGPCGSSSGAVAPTAGSSMVPLTNSKRADQNNSPRQAPDPVDWMDGGGEDVFFDGGGGITELNGTTTNGQHNYSSISIDGNPQEHGHEESDLDESLMMLGFLPRAEKIDLVNDRGMNDRDNHAGGGFSPPIPVDEYPQVDDDGTKADEVIKIKHVSEEEARRRYFAAFRGETVTDGDDDVPLVGESRRELPVMDF